MDHRLVELACNTMSQVLADWDAMVGLPVELVRASAFEVKTTAELRDRLGDEWLAIQTLLIAGEEGPLFFLFPRRLVQAVSRAALMMPDDDDDDTLGEAELEAFKEMGNLLCGSSNRVYQSLGRDLRVSQSVEHLRLHPDLGESEVTADDWPNPPIVVVRFFLKCGDRSHSVLQVIGTSLAADVVAPQ